MVGLFMIRRLFSHNYDLAKSGVFIFNRSRHLESYNHTFCLFLHLLIAAVILFQNPPKPPIRKGAKPWTLTVDFRPGQYLAVDPKGRRGKPSVGDGIFFCGLFFGGGDFGCDVLFFLKFNKFNQILFWEVFFRVGICLLFFFWGFGTFSEASFLPRCSDDWRHWKAEVCWGAYVQWGNLQGEVSTQGDLEKHIQKPIRYPFFRYRDVKFLGLFLAFIHSLRCFWWKQKQLPNQIFFVPSTKPSVVQWYPVCWRRFVGFQKRFSNVSTCGLGAKFVSLGWIQRKILRKFLAKSMSWNLLRSNDFKFANPFGKQTYSLEMCSFPKGNTFGFSVSFIKIKGSLFLSFALPLRNGDALKKSGMIFEIWPHPLGRENLKKGSLASYFFTQYYII